MEQETKTTLTDLDLYLGTGISKTRMSRLTTQANSYLRASELYLIALAIDVDRADLQKDLYSDLKLIK